MAQKLHFSLVSPERELVSKEVDSVDIPGSEGWIGILPNHTPFMTTLAPGVIILKEAGAEEKFFVRGGFAEVTPDGLTILAEDAVPVKELDSDALGNHIKEARSRLEQATEKMTAETGASQVLSAQQNLERLEELQKAN